MSLGGKLGQWWRALTGQTPAVEPAPPPKVSREALLAPDWFERALVETRFLARYPRYTGIVARMDPIATSAVPVMAVGLRRRGDPRSRLVLSVNLEHFHAHPEQWVGVLHHEIRHVVLGHLTDELLHRVTYPRIVELAMEISADEHVPELTIEDAHFPVAAFEHLGVRPGQSTMERYVVLRDAHERGGLSDLDHWFPRIRDRHRMGESVGAGLGDLIDERSDGATDRQWRRRGWGLGAPSSRGEIRRMREAIAAHLRGPRGGALDAHEGTHELRAKELSRVVLDAGAQPSLHWARVLREAFPGLRRVVPDYRRPNRRFRERVGEIPGRARRPPRPRLLAAVDTSGSMDGAALDRIAHELRALARHAELLVAECDAEVHRIRPYRGSVDAFLGGGDTDFTPVFDEAGARRDLDGVVYFTDGRGRMPSTPPSLPVLWALTHDGPFHAETGSIVRLVPTD